MTTTTNYVSGHHVHASIEPGLTVCGKRTEALEESSSWTTCPYCNDHKPTVRVTLPTV